jgi:hypothetical protein
MRELIFPERARLQLVGIDTRGRRIPLALPGVVLGVQTFARYRNDYHLAPFFTDATGAVEMTEEVLRIFAAAELESAIMDYDRIDHAFPLVEIRVWTGEEVERAVEARGSWGLLGRETELWGSAEALIARLRASPNARLRVVPNAGFGLVRDEWDGTGTPRDYELLVSEAPAG